MNNIVLTTKNTNKCSLTDRSVSKKAMPWFIIRLDMDRYTEQALLCVKSHGKVR